MSEKIYVYQFLRAIASLGAAFGHLFYPPIFEETLNFFYPAQISLGIFFFISGYLIFKSFEKNTIKEFLIQRFFRIFPTFWAVGIIAVIVYYSTGYVRGRSDIVTIKDILGYFLFLKDFIPNIKHITSSNWTLYPEVYFYIITAIIVFILRKKNLPINFKNTLKYFTPLLLILFIILIYANYQIKMYGRNIGVILFILCGTCFYFKEKMLISSSQYWKAVSALSIFGILFGINFEKIKYSNIILISYFSYFISIIIAYNIIKYRNFFKPNKIIIFFANTSYPLFLFHQTFGEISGLTGHSLGFLKYLGYDVIYIDRLIFFICITIPVCYIMHIAIEKPCIKFSKKLFKANN